MQQSVLNIYRALLRESAKFPQYNIRKYYQRRVREEFHKYKTITSGDEIQELVKAAEKTLSDIQRQSVVYQLYARPLKNIMDLPEN